MPENTQIEFRLAQKDPNGNCTNGIDRVASPRTYGADETSKLNGWPRNRYLNVWVVHDMKDLSVGYSLLPAVANNFPNSDGVLMVYKYIGSIGEGSTTRSRSLTHEIGHCLNLYHVWGDKNIDSFCNGDDLVPDTPPTKGWTRCPPNLIDSAKVCNPNVVENIQNYMEYSFCSNMFTKDQVTRMRTTLTSSIAGRDNLWSPSNLIATGTDGFPAQLCKSEFVSDYNYMCEGSTVTFTDKSWNGHPTSWDWSFPGGTPTTSTDSIPKIKYDAAGNFDVTLTVGNSTGSKTTIKQAFIKIFSTTGKYENSSYSEGFEGDALPNADWIINSDVTPAWQKTSNAKYEGTASMFLNNFSNGSNNVDAAISPTIDLTKIAQPKLFFRVAFAQKKSTNNDQLRVFVSVDCGKTWIPRYEKYNTVTNGLSTAPIQTSSFIPTQSQWRLETINLSTHRTSKKAMIKFEFTSDGGNNIYIDDINISGVTGIMDELAYHLDFSIYPNPINDLSVISFNLTDKQKINLKIYDLLGKEVYTVIDNELNTGEHKYNVSKINQNLKAGIYFVNLTVGGRLFTQKMILN